MPALIQAGTAPAATWLKQPSHMALPVHVTVESKLGSSKTAISGSSLCGVATPHQLKWQQQHSHPLLCQSARSTSHSSACQDTCRTHTLPYELSTAFRFDEQHADRVEALVGCQEPGVPDGDHVKLVLPRHRVALVCLVQPVVQVRQAGHGAEVVSPRGCGGGLLGMAGCQHLPFKKPLIRHPDEAEGEPVPLPEQVLCHQAAHVLEQCACAGHVEVRSDDAQPPPAARNDVDGEGKVSVADRVIGGDLFEEPRGAGPTCNEVVRTRS
eukprot:CAMPEP_0202917202 /NCGR_PEP_ID=MMETSP1392-20130828/70456_1 /ASSEMBLY_ACC=CAM_ASM_000868 /TAXON_ID=225041 /ORGANISM="Chlamydomonas chlamydogama, Strain SAG 11-48b" /LENGTH=267 /DNA_ID=CAMNT_0049609877 /DNA_START=651 /DNA_END=1454 /DNA_ORIENTATION=+